MARKVACHTLSNAYFDTYEDAVQYLLMLKVPVLFHTFNVNKTGKIQEKGSLILLLCYVTLWNTGGETMQSQNPAIQVTRSSTISGSCYS